VVVALVATASSVVQVVRERARLAQLAGVPGVVAPVVGPVNELWATDRQPDLAGAHDVGGVMVDTWSGPDGTVVRGVDPRTGSDVWSRTLEGAGSHVGRCALADGPVSGTDRAVLVCLVVDAATSADAGARSVPTQVHLDVLDPRTGAVLSTLPAAPTDVIAGLGADIVVARVLAGGVQLSRIDPRTGSVAWTTDLTRPAGVGASSTGLRVFAGHVVVDAGALAWEVSGTGVVQGHWSDLPTSTTWAIWRTTGGHLLRATFAPFGGETTVTDLRTGVRVVASGTVQDLVGVDDGSAPDLLLVGGARLTAWDLSTGAERWHVDGPADSVVVLDGIVYSVSSNVLRAQDAETGVVRWVRRNHYGPMPTLETDGQSLYVATISASSVASTLRAVSLSDGSLVWTSTLTGSVVSLLVLAGQLFTTTPGGRLVALG
jgi:outer membrane protein assembly factor BamB